MRIDLVQDEEEYEKFIFGNEFSLLYFSVKYKYFLSKIIANAKFCYWGLYSNGGLKGVLPAVIREDPPGTVINSLPFYGSNGGVIADTLEAKEELLRYYVDFCRRYVTWSNVITSPFEWTHSLYEEILSPAFIDKRIGQFVRLHCSSRNELMGKFHVKTRNATRRAQKDNFFFEIDNSDEAWRFLQRTHTENMEAIGGTPKDGNVFEALKAVFEPHDDYDIYVAYTGQSEPAAALLLLYYKNTVEYFTPVSKLAYRKYQPMSFLIYESMWESIQRGYRYWNFGGTWPSQKELYRFKARWGAETNLYYYYVNVFGDGLNIVRELGKDNILEQYKYFYVIPFNKLMGG
jgi:hypothetical protein